MEPLQSLAEAKAAERRKEIQEGKRTDNRDLFTYMRLSTQALCWSVLERLTLSSTSSTQYHGERYTGRYEVV